MEKRYIWFDTGAGFVAGSLGVLLAAAGVFYLAVLRRANLWQFGVLILAALLLLIWPAFLIDRRWRTTSNKHRPRD